MAKFDLTAFAVSCGATWGLCMLFLGIVSIFNWGTAAVNTIGSVYIGFAPTWLGAIIGAIWGFVDGAIGGVIFALIYNAMAKD